MDIIKSMYTGCSATLGSLEASIAISLGLKQGEILAPLHVGETITIVDNRLVAMADADDMSLLADTQEGIGTLLSTEKYLAGVGMGLSAPKCEAIHHARKGETWMALPVDLTIEGQPLQVYTAGSSFGYLELTFSIHKGSRTASKLTVTRLALNSHQKVTLLMPSPIDTSSQNELDQVDTLLKLEHKGKPVRHQKEGQGALVTAYYPPSPPLCTSGGRSVAADARSPASGAGLAWWVACVRVMARWATEHPLPTNTKGHSGIQDKEFRRWAIQLAHGQGINWFQKNALGNHWLLN
ncbi:hypothetical protein J6590_067073 [Homalodisca vitripennis]|nr:hypothetical protein J6590_067073 [Homalodisca vitripennis]